MTSAALSWLTSPGDALYRCGSTPSPISCVDRDVLAADVAHQVGDHARRADGRIVPRPAVAPRRKSVDTVV